MVKMIETELNVNKVKTTAFSGFHSSTYSCLKATIIIISNLTVFSSSNIHNVNFYLHKAVICTYN